MLGNHMPRQCGIATFTTHLGDALTAEFPAIDCFVLAMNDPGRRHATPTQSACVLKSPKPTSIRIGEPPIS